MIQIFSLRQDFSDCVTPSILADFFVKVEKEKEEAQKSSEMLLINKEVRKPMSEKMTFENKLLTSAKIIERMVNLNNKEDIALDYRFYEDPADEYKEKEGTLLPLWTFQHKKKEGLEITGLQWSPKYADLFGASYGSFDFYANSKFSGFLCFFSLKNQSYPEYICTASSGITCMDIHPKYSYMVVAGLFDGNIAVYNLMSKSSDPCYSSSAEKGKHRDVVWSVVWAKDNLDGYLNFYSCSGDGRITNWTLVKTSLWHCDQLVLHFDKSLVNSSDLSKELLVGARDIAFNPEKESLYLVGTDEGHILLCSTEYSSDSLRKYRAHITPVNSVSWNPFYPSLFISCASESMVHVWHKDLSDPILSFDTRSPVGDVAWAPYSSTVFGVVTCDGFLRMFDIYVNKYQPMCRQVGIEIFVSLFP